MENEIKSVYERLTTGFIEFAPRIAMVAILFLLGYVVARIAAHLTKKFILYVNRILNDKLQTSLLKVDLLSSSRFVSKAIFWILMLVTVLLCIQLLQLEFIGSLVSGLITYLPNVFASFVIIFIGIISSRLVGDVISSAASRTAMVNGKYLGRLVRYLIVFVAIVIGVNQLGIDIQFLTNVVLIALGALLFGASFAFGLGAKTSIANILGAYYVRKSFKLGTTIEIEDVKGVIVRITDHSVTVETNSGFVVIPSEKFNQTKVQINKD